MRAVVVYLVHGPGGNSHRFLRRYVLSATPAVLEDSELKLFQALFSAYGMPTVHSVVSLEYFAHSMHPRLWRRELGKFKRSADRRCVARPLTGPANKVKHVMAEIDELDQKMGHQVLCECVTCFVEALLAMGSLADTSMSQAVLSDASPAAGATYGTCIQDSNFSRPGGLCTHALAVYGLSPLGPVTEE